MCIIFLTRTTDSYGTAHILVYKSTVYFVHAPQQIYKKVLKGFTTCQSTSLHLVIIANKQCHVVHTHLSCVSEPAMCHFV